MRRRNTRQRQIILNAIRGRYDHPDAETIYNQIHAQHPKISLATVYRNLAVLSEEGQISVVKLPGADRFDLKTAHHYHFVCEKCGELFDIPVEYNQELDNINITGGFVIHSHQTIFKGICPKCREKNK